MSADISMDLPLLNWTFQHELPDIDCIGIDTEQAYIHQDQTNNEFPNQQSLSMLKYIYSIESQLENGLFCQQRMPMRYIYVLIPSTLPCHL